MDKSRSFIGKLRSRPDSDVNDHVFICILLTFAFLFFSLNCSFEKPSAPSWDTNVSIPLVNKAYTMADLAEEESSISLDDNDMLHFEVNAELDNYTIGDELTLESMQDFFSFNLGSFSVQSPASVVRSVVLSEIFSQATALHGQTVIVPSFNFVTDKKSLDPYDNFSYVVLESGDISVHVDNNLAVPLGSPLTLEIWDSVQDTLIVTNTSSTQIPAGGTADFMLSLANQKIPNQLSVRMSGFSPGSEGSSVLVDENSSFAIDTGISNLSVTEALAKIPAQVFSGEEQLAINDSVVIIDAKIESGSVDFLVSGNLPLDTWLTYELPDFVAPDGSTLKDSVFIARNTASNISISLNNYSLQPAAADFGEQKVRFSWSARTVDTGANMVLVKSSDLINTNFNLPEVKFYQLSGKFAQKEFSVEQNDIEFDIPADLDSIFFETARLELSIVNGINFPARLDLTIEGQNEAGVKAQMNINETIQAASAPGVPVTSIIVLDQQNSNIKEFIRIVPNLLRVSGRVILGDENLPGTISKNDFVSGLVKITAPFILKLTSQSIETEVLELKIDEKVRNKIIENLLSGLLFAEIENHLPVGATVDIVFSQDKSNLYGNPVLEITAIRADAAGVDESGLVQNPKSSATNFGLTKEQIQTFLLSPLYAGVRISLEGTNDKFVTLRGSDYIGIKSYSKLNVTVNRD